MSVLAATVRQPGVVALAPSAGLSLAMEEFLAAQALRCDAGALGSAQVVGVRGCSSKRQGSDAEGLSMLSDPARITDQHDDAILVFGRKPKGSRYAAVYRASLHPGKSSFSKGTGDARSCSRGSTSTAAGQAVYHYALIDGWFLDGWQRADQAGRRALDRLWFGSHGDPVRRLQQRLVELGHYHADGVDGEYGPKTHMALRRYQRREGLSETGVVDRELAGRLRIL